MQTQLCAIIIVYGDQICIDLEQNLKTQLRQTMIHEFSQMALPREVLKSIESIGFEAPSWVQCQCIPPMLRNRDVICFEKSGMGKTAAMVMCILTNLKYVRHTKCIIVVQYWTIAHAIKSEINRIGKFLQLQAIVVSNQNHGNLNEYDIIIGEPAGIYNACPKIECDLVSFFVVDNINFENMGMYENFQSTHS
jgi:ATP-dependent RNA helicase DeaD